MVVTKHFIYSEHRQWRDILSPRMVFLWRPTARADSSLVLWCGFVMFDMYRLPLITA